MTREEYLKMRKEKEAEIKKINNEIEMLKEQYCKDNAPFNIGDRIRLNGKEGVISVIKVWFDDFEYYWRPFRKDGTEGAEKRIWSYDYKNIERI